MKKIYKVCLLGFIIDQVIKFIVSGSMMTNKSITIIPNFFSLTYVHNTGAAWSILSGSTILLIIIGIGVLFGIYWFLIRGKYLNHMEQLYYGLLIGGIMGNLVDRIIYGHVIDYLDFKIFGYNFPIFNFADILITLGAIIMVIEIIKGREVNERVQSRK